MLVESGKVQELTEGAAQFIQKVLDTYGRYTGLQLANMCRSQPPWMETRVAYKSCRQPNKLIPAEAIVRYYGSFMGKEVTPMSVEKKYRVIAETVEELDALISDPEIDLRTVWDTWVTQLGGDHALYYVGDLLEAIKEECQVKAAGGEWCPEESLVTGDYDPPSEV